jgi:hypothetical protein
MTPSKNRKVKKIKAWAVVGKENNPTIQLCSGGEKSRLKYAWYFDIFTERKWAVIRKSWINKFEQKDYKIAPIEIKVLTLPNKGRQIKAKK